jgi:hypothetical protein
VRCVIGTLPSAIQTNALIEEPLVRVPGGRQPLPNRVTSEFPVICPQSPNLQANPTCDKCEEAKNRFWADARLYGHTEITPERAPAGDGGSCLCDNLLREANSPQQCFEPRVRPEIVNPQVRFEVPGDIQGSLLVSSF